MSMGRDVGLRYRPVLVVHGEEEVAVPVSVALQRGVMGAGRRCQREEGGFPGLGNAIGN